MTRGTAGFIVSLALGLLALPLAADAERPAGKVPRVGIVWIGSQAAVGDLHAAFLEGLRDLGYSDGRNIAVEARFGDGKVEALPRLMGELIGLKVDVIVAPGTPIVRAARAATTTIPIVMANVADPVGLGFVESIARPGKNVTGMSNFTIELGAKALELIKEAIPKASRVAVLLNPTNPAAELFRRGLRAPAGALQLSLSILEVGDPARIEDTLGKAAKQHADALLVVTAEGLFSTYRKQILEFAVRHRMAPVVSSIPGHYAEAGALMVYGANSAGMFRDAAKFVDKILRGAKAADLPVEQPTTLELVVNLKTAKALGLTIPQSVLILADRVIQ